MTLPRVCQKELLQKLTELGIAYDKVEHPEVFTVEQALPHVAHLEGIFAKNLFLKDKKKQFYLFCAPHDCDVKLNDLSKLVKASGGLRFADESVLFEKLGLTQGSVTVFGLLNDTEHNVKLVLDDRFTNNTYTKIYFHPMVNTSSIAITPQGLMTFLKSTGHEPLKINLTE